MELSEINTLKIFYFEGILREGIFEENILLTETYCYN
tara:strand:+ start:844 stop:954 length:111 start_codon:yes stop_codon:yes gene_type:complete